MFPVILISNNLKKQQSYIEGFIKVNHILPYYIYEIKPEKSEISIDQIRLIKKEIVTFVKDKRLFIIYNFDNASAEAQNALLKTLEENTQNNLFILLVKENEHVIPTIRSRAKIIILSKNDSEKSNNDLYTFLSSVEKTHNYSFLADKMTQGLTREELLSFIDEIIFYYQKKLQEGNEKNTKILRQSLRLKNLLQNNNLNPQLTIDSLLIYIKKTCSMK